MVGWKRELGEDCTIVQQRGALLLQRLRQDDDAPRVAGPGAAPESIICTIAAIFFLTIASYVLTHKNRTHLVLVKKFSEPFSIAMVFTVWQHSVGIHHMLCFGAC